jgi:predicted Rossmann fold flavoprotein
MYDVIVIGAGASGLMCAIEAGKRGRRVLVLDHSDRLARKVYIAGGGKCNFTNMEVDPKVHLISSNLYFPISAISRYSQWDFLDMIDRYQIPYEEREHGQLFTTTSSADIIRMLRQECESYEVEIRLKREISKVIKTETGFDIEAYSRTYSCESLVIATGGLSFPKIGASRFGLFIAEQFGLKCVDVRPGLVPLSSNDDGLKALSGLNFPVTAECNGRSFSENLLITHSGLSGPVILQISNYWKSGDVVTINLLPKLNLNDELTNRKQSRQKSSLQKVLAEYLPKRFVVYMLESNGLPNKQVNQLNEAEIKTIAESFNSWQFKPSGTEGYRTAEVTVGGVSTDEISSKTMESKKVPGLFFIGEVLDVTGHLGGYNLQWAWSSGYCAGQYV